MPENKAPTQFVGTDTDGMYVAPPRNFDRLKAITSHLQPVTKDGFDRPRAKPDDSVTNVVTPAAPPTMADALAAAADAVGADLPTLLDSQAFRTAITPISPNNQAELQSVIRDHMPAPAASGMASNPSQGHVGGPVPAPASASLLERLKAQAAKSADQPLPPGSTVV